MATTHARYMEGSDTYRGLVTNYGRALEWTTAERFVREHGHALEDLITEGLVGARPDGRIDTLSLVVALGY